MLALGFVGLDFPQDATELIEAAVLAQGEEAGEFGLAPSPYEDLLARDYLFALRCLGDRIQVLPTLREVLLERLVSELLSGSGLVQFWRYRIALYGALRFLHGTDDARAIVDRLVDALHHGPVAVRRRAAEAINFLGDLRPDVVAALRTAMADDDSTIRASALESFARLADADVALQAILTATRDVDPSVRKAAFRAMSRVSLIEEAAFAKALSTTAALTRAGRMNSDFTPADR